MNVKEAASMLVCFSAARQRSELLAKAIIAAEVRIKARAFKEKEFVNEGTFSYDDTPQPAQHIVDTSRGDR